MVIFSFPSYSFLCRKKNERYGNTPYAACFLDANYLLSNNLSDKKHTE